MNKITVKTIDKSDIKATSGWFNKLIDEKPWIVENSRVDPENNPFLEEQIKSAKDRKSIALIMKSDDKVVAKIDIKPLSREVDKHVGEVSFGVLKGYDKESIDLVKEGCKRAKQLGLKVLIYYILDKNKRFISIIQKAGFRKACRIRRFYKKNQRYYDRVILEKQA